MNGTLVIEAVRKTVTVDCAVEEAFRVFTEDATSWWPARTHSIHGEAVTAVVFEGRVGGEVYEVASSGDRAHWGTVLSWEPPGRLVLAWEVSPGVTGTEVEVRFVPDGDATRVELEHRGWERAAEGAAEKRDDYDTGWDYVLGVYREHVS
jgi:uncharacterized protein YndB with AHSA1/START domain